MSEPFEPLLVKLGFRFGVNGPHAARTMMLEDIRALFSQVPVTADRPEFREAIVAANVLGKPTKKARELAYRHIATLYGLEPGNPIFRALRRLWVSDVAAQPLLALLVAVARDPLLAHTQSFVLSKISGTVVPRSAVEAFLSELHPGRFSEASLKSFAQNVLGTWTTAGFLVGRTRKHRAQPEIRPATVVLALLLGYLEGRTGQRLFTTKWVELLGVSQESLESLAMAAHHKGLLVFMEAGGVKEVRFPGYLTPEEEQIRQEVSHVF